MNLSPEPLTRNRLEDAFAGNRLLATLSAQDRALIAPHMEVIALQPGDRLFGVGAEVDRSIFPFDTLMVSMMVELKGGRSVEVASIGKEGAIGGIVSCGTSPAFAHSVVQIAGSGAAIPIRVLEFAKQASPHLRNVFCRYSDYLLSQVMQSVACNAFHSIEERAARWLLHAQDRVGDERIALTQESLAGLLGVQRTTVNAVVRVLQDQGLIANRRGAIQVKDRHGLAKVACGCYTAVEEHFAAVLGPDGRGGTQDDCD
jgi:hypothetical protein